MSVRPPVRALVLGGTREATLLCRLMAARGVAGIVSLAGRVARPAPQALPLRVGGFGGIAGLMHTLEEEGITHVIDATHPFAAQMSAHAVAACAAAGLPLVALTRPPWQPVPGDRWQGVPDIAGAVAALAGPRRRVLLAVGRMHLPAFEVQPQHAYLLRLVDPPAQPPGFPDHHVIVDRGPFTLEGDRALMQAHGIELVLSKNAGGTGAQAKITAARQLGLPVVMIERPAIPPRRQVGTPEEVLEWLSHTGTDLGV